jgi:galactokinase
MGQGHRKKLPRLKVIISPNKPRDGRREDQSNSKWNITNKNDHTSTVTNNSTLKNPAEHVINEQNRVEKTVKLLGNGEKSARIALGALLEVSHRSLQHDDQVSCKELDTIGDIALFIGRYT